MIKVLVTRPERQASSLCNLLQAAGCQPVRLPLLAVEAVTLTDEARQCLATPIAYLIFISANAVNFAFSEKNGKIRQQLQASAIAAVGKATAEALLAHGLTVDLLPGTGFNSEALLAMPALQQVAGQHIVIVRGVGGRELLADTLRARGAHVDYLEVYRRLPVSNDISEVAALLRQQQLHALMLSSGEALTHLLTLFKADATLPLLLATPLVVVSERLGTEAMAAGFTQVVVSEGPSDLAVFTTIKNLVRGENRG